MNPQRLAMILRRGYAALEAGNPAEAAACAREVLRSHDRHPPAHFLVGLAALAAGERKVAFRAFTSVTTLVPAHAAAWTQLARLYLGEGEVDEASSAVQRAIATRPDEPLVLDLIGSVLSLLGDHLAAGEWFSRAVRSRPDHVPFLQNLANNQVVLGDTTAAESTWRLILERDGHHAQAHWALSGVRTAVDHTHIDTMRQLLAANRLHPRAAAFLWYACGKESEDLGLWEKAFAAFAAGAAARRETVEFDETNEAATFNTLLQSFTADWADGRTGFEAHERIPIFIVGEPRTGTTLIERILAAHSQVHAAGELQHFHLALRQLGRHHDPRRFTPELFGRARQLDPAAIGKRYIESTRRLQGGKPYFIDKLPQNYLCLPLIKAALPRARIIHLTRHPMDACFASFKQLFADAYLHSYTQEEMARHHVRYRQLMEAWRERFGGAFLDVAYEDTVQDIEGTARRLLGWIGLPFEDTCLHFHETRGAVTTASAVQVREPAHARSIGRWRRYETQLAPMRAVLEAAGIATD